MAVRNRGVQMYIHYITLRLIHNTGGEPLAIIT